MSKGKLAGIIIVFAIAIIVVIVIVTRPPTSTPAPSPTVTRTLLVSVSPSGAGSVSPAGGEYSLGAQVTLTASPTSGYAFDCWERAASGSSNTVTITMDSDKIIIAHFRAVEAEPTPELGKREQYFVDRKITGYNSMYEPEYQYVYMGLTTIAYWEKDTQGSPTTWTNPLSGHKSRDWVIDFKTHQTRWVINWYYKPRASSPLDLPNYRPALNVVVWDKATFDRSFGTEDRGLIELRIATEADTRGVSDKGVHCTIVHQAGDYVIVVTPSAVEDIVDWWVKVGGE